VAWRETPEGSPREAEIELLSRFRVAHGGRPPIASIAGNEDVQRPVLGRPSDD
jgi:hypothetical protein